MCTTFSSFCLNSFACTHPPINSITTEEFCFYRMFLYSENRKNTIVLFLHLLKFKYHLLNESCFSRDIYKLQVPGSGRCTMRGSGGGGGRSLGRLENLKYLNSHSKVPKNRDSEPKKTPIRRKFWICAKF